MQLREGDANRKILAAANLGKLSREQENRETIIEGGAIPEYKPEEKTEGENDETDNVSTETNTDNNGTKDGKDEDL